MSIWQQISKEFFSKLYASDDTTTSMPPKLGVKPTSTMHKKSSGKDGDGDSIDDESNDDDDTSDDSTMESSTTKHYRHITLSRGLSKYGPWGYLILGMLLCGGALLVCVLWGNYRFFSGRPLHPCFVLHVLSLIKLTKIQNPRSKSRTNFCFACIHLCESIRAICK